MKAPLLIVVSLLCACRAFGDDIKPVDPDAPLFQIYELHLQLDPKEKDPHMHHAAQGALLLAVYSLADLHLCTDKKGVRVILTDSDAKVFAGLTHTRDMLFLMAGDSTSVVLHIVGPIEDGEILFDDSTYSGDVATYLRQRYRVKPNSNEIEQPATSVP